MARELTARTHPWSLQDCGPLDVFRTGWRQRELIMRLAKREVAARYRGSALGTLWSVLIPLMMLGVYTFVFSFVFRMKFGELSGGRGEFALMLFSGLIVFNLLAECLNRAPSLMLENVSYIKKIVFPLEALPWVMLLGALFNAAVSTGVLLVGYLIFLGLPPLTALLFPLMLVPLAVLSLGASWLLASLGVFLRDLRQFIPVLTTILLFMSPIFYPREAVPAPFQPLLNISPLATSIEAARAVLFAGNLPNAWLLAGNLVLAWLVAWLGLWWFTKTRKGFADVV